MSLVIYRGPSAYDPSVTIRAVLVPDSGNSKTGNMAQLFILHDAVAPQVAQRTGEDAAVCGSCPLRPANAGGCYVVTCQGPLSTWKATATRGIAGAGEVSRALKGKTLRLGAYGDPAALPYAVIQYLARLVKGKATGYTHGWRSRPDLKRFCMASVESTSQAIEAHAAGWRTFRVTTPEAPAMEREIACPSDRVSCSSCLLCRGASLAARSITIPAHGTFVRRALNVVNGGN
jgi:hypothetical protein